MTAPDLDASLELLSDGLRRRALRELRADSNGEVTVRELSGRLSDAANGPDDRDRIAVRLRHQHLPKLDSHGVVDHNRERGIVRYRPDNPVESVLESVSTEAVVDGGTE